MRIQKQIYKSKYKSNHAWFDLYFDLYANMFQAGHGGPWSCAEQDRAGEVHEDLQDRGGQHRRRYEVVAPVRPHCDGREAVEAEACVHRVSSLEIDFVLAHQVLVGL